jgi:hypothetical protein
MPVPTTPASNTSFYSCVAIELPISIVKIHHRVPAELLNYVGQTDTR